VSTRGVHSMLRSQPVPNLGRHGRGSDSTTVPLASLSVSRRWLPPTRRTLSAVAFHGSGVARGGPAGVDGGQVGGCPTTRSSRRPSPCHAACRARVAPPLGRGLPRALNGFSDPEGAMPLSWSQNVWSRGADTPEGERRRGPRLWRRGATRGGLRWRELPAASTRAAADISWTAEVHFSRTGRVGPSGSSGRAPWGA
jgi:hypothetical protein